MPAWYCSMPEAVIDGITVIFYRSKGLGMGAEMKKKQHITAFYMEMLVLTAVFIVVILILTQVFALSRGQSARALLL